ncbi:MAG TPA: TetR/AcrR family transcriptional regulator [Acidimicrobiales bacterium]
MPKVADPAVRVALIEAAARITAEEGRDALTLRRLAAEVGASTMAVYTHFGGMTELRRAVRREGFARLAAHLARVDDTDDPVADVIALGAAYYRMALANPHLYRAMFMDGKVDDEDAHVGLETYQPLLRGVGRCLDAGRFSPATPHELARQVWATLHGFVSLHIAGMIAPRDAAEGLESATRSFLVAFGDTPEAAEASLRRGRERGLASGEGASAR